MEPNNPEKNKLKFKLKLPSPPQQQKATPIVDDDEELEEGEFRAELEPEEVNTSKRVCPHCSKEFSNGKALGGHLRIHAVEKDYKTAKVMKKQKFVIGSSSGNPDEERSFWCNICDRRYHSEKALYGHMRSHPERGYRGMEPPFNRCRSSFSKNNNNGCGTDEDEDEDEDGGESPGVGELRWKVTRKRGHKIMDSTVEVSSSNFEAAATELMLFMANGGGVSKDGGEDEDEDEDGAFMKKVKGIIKEKLGKSGVIIEKKKKKKREKFGEDCVIIKEKKSGIKKEKLHEIEGILKEKGFKIEEFDEDELYFLQDELGISSVFAADDSDESSLATSIEEIRRTKSDKKEKKKKKKKKKRKRNSGSEPGFEPNKHPKKDDDDDDDGGGGGDNDKHDDDDKGDSPPHDWPCYTCGKIFNSHQALGGHRSSHNKKNYSKSSHLNNSTALALTLAQGAQLQIDQGSGLTDMGPGSNGGSRSGSGEVNGGAFDRVNRVFEVGESSSSPPYKCNICNERFHSGQALGGHMRCHYAPSSFESLRPLIISPPALTTRPPALTGSPSAQTSSPSAETSSPTAQTSSPPVAPSVRPCMMIDLNVSLMDEEEDGDGTVLLS